MMWHCAEIVPLYKYLLETRNTPHPLILAGMDVQFLENCTLYYESELRKFCKFLDTQYHVHIALDSSFIHTLKKEMRYSNTFAKLRESDTLILHNKFYEILDGIRKVNLKDDMLTFWETNCINGIIDYRRAFQKTPPLRDSMMCENIKTVRELYGKKVIVWAASIHLVNSTTSVQNAAYQISSTGSFLKKAFGSKYLSIAFTNNFGRGGYREKGLLSYKFAPGSEFSLEGYIERKFKCDIAMFSTKDGPLVTDIPLFKISSSKFFWRKEIPMNISETFDAVFYIKKMHPPNYKFLRK